MEKEQQYQNKPDNLDNYDKFCWKCHTKVNIRKICRSCCRSFHKYCVDNDMERLTCSVCVRLKETQQASSERPPNMRLLAQLMIQILKSPKFKMLEYMGCWKFDLNNNNKIINPIDLSIVNEKVMSRDYNTLVEFLVDIEWIYHNCFIYFSESHKFTTSASELLHVCNSECEFMKNCPNCYECKHGYSSDWMIRPCNQPHLILWAEIRDLDFWPADKGFRYWPAKVLAIEDEHLRIIFFGHHELSKVNAIDCYLYSGKNPNPVNLASDPRDLAVALEEVESYIKNVCTKFGVFVNVVLDSIPLRTPFKVQSISEYLEMIYPGLGNRIRVQDDSVLDVSRDTSSLVLHEPNDQSTPTLTNVLDTSYSSGCVAYGRKTPLFTSVTESEEIPEKRYRFDTETTISSMTPMVMSPGVSDCKENFKKCMKSFAGVFDHVFDLNIKLEDRIRQLITKSAIEVNALEKCNARLSERMDKVNKDMRDELELMKRQYYLKVIDINQENEQNLAKKTQDCERQFNRQLKSVNDKYEMEMTQLKDKYDKTFADYEVERKRFFMEKYELKECMEKERERAIEDVKKMCKEEYETLIEDAKNKKFCISCGVGKPLDLFYVCDTNCQKNYCGKKFKK